MVHGGGDIAVLAEAASNRVVPVWTSSKLAQRQSTFYHSRQKSIILGTELKFCSIDSAFCAVGDRTNPTSLVGALPELKSNQFISVLYITM